VQRLLADGHKVCVIDSLHRGHREAIDALMPTSGGRLHFEAMNIGDESQVETLLRTHAVDTVMHFAALAYVGESVDQPLWYYENNVSAALRLLAACDRVGVARFVFSSSCATYGQPADGEIPIRETCPQNPVSPYGQTKLIFEHILRDWAGARERTHRPVAVAMLRYFNVAGADRSGVLGEDHDPESHLIPVALQAALGLREHLTIFGTDYPTPDGTCIRDYVHVEDLIDAHVRVMNSIEPGQTRAYNIGIGQGHSVRQVIDAVERVTGQSLDIRCGPRRPGDPAALFNDPSHIRSELGWQASITNLDDIVRSAWRWMQRHPRGYATSPEPRITT
jgi:UDP-glucose-4-epimerase GalE